VRIAAKIIGLVIVIYFASFTWCFDLLSSPVRNKHGWPGPLGRGDTHSIDIGKTYDHTQETTKTVAASNGQF
jgi:hypothetical protein